MAWLVVSVVIIHCSLHSLHRQILVCSRFPSSLWLSHSALIGRPWYPTPFCVCAVLSLSFSVLIGRLWDTPCSTACTYFPSPTSTMQCLQPVFCTFMLFSSKKKKKKHRILRPYLFTWSYLHYIFTQLTTIISCSGVNDKSLSVFVYGRHILAQPRLSVTCHISIIKIKFTGAHCSGLKWRMQVQIQADIFLAW